MEKMTLVTIVDEADFGNVKERFLIKSRYDGNSFNENPKLTERVRFWKDEAGEEWEYAIKAEFDEIELY